MIDKKLNANEQVQRMKSLMNYGLTESKQPEYSNVEYTKVAADGKLYGIVREGTKYYIKVGRDVNGGLISENFDYIGGFRNRKENMFESFASAQRFFVEKMICINESIDDKQKRVIAESWDLDAKKEVIEEGTKKMQSEIARQKQIMKNVQALSENKKQECCDMIGGCKVEKPKNTEENYDETGAPFNKSPEKEYAKNEKPNIKGKTKPVKESTETPLVSRENPEYMDMSHGTGTGNTAPFNVKVKKSEGAVAEDEGGETESIHEGISLHSTDNQNSPTPGVGKKGDNQPFEDEVEITEDVEIDDTIEDDEYEDDGEDEVAGDDFDVDNEEPVLDDNPDIDDEEGDTEFELEVDDEKGDTAARLDALEDKLDTILDAINNMKYDDDDELYDDDNTEGDDDETEYEVETDFEGPVGEPDAPEEFEDDEEEVDDETEVVESRSYKALKAKMLREENYFGKHPAYQKKVMTTPPINMPYGDGQYDMNDGSVEGEKPYGISKGNQKPFEHDVEAIENAVTESIMRDLKKKLA